MAYHQNSIDDPLQPPSSFWNQAIIPSLWVPGNSSGNRLPSEAKPGGFGGGVSGPALNLKLFRGDQVAYETARRGTARGLEPALLQRSGFSVVDSGLVD